VIWRNRINRLGEQQLGVALAATASDAWRCAARPQYLDAFGCRLTKRHAADDLGSLRIALSNGITTLADDFTILRGCGLWLLSEKPVWVSRCLVP
jgi:hypothetical protein